MITRVIMEIDNAGGLVGDGVWNTVENNVKTKMSRT
jgi:hypothetical protein